MSDFLIAFSIDGWVKRVKQERKYHETPPRTVADMYRHQLKGWAIQSL